MSAVKNEELEKLKAKYNFTKSKVYNFCLI